MTIICNIEPWFLLYNGQSEDGMGHPNYVGRTNVAADAEVLLKEIEANIYSTGHVVVVFDEHTEQVHTVAAFRQVLEENQ